MGINLTKNREFFDPTDVKKQIHIIGCGSVGSTLAELLARHGITNISLYDFDVVSAHNIANQMFNDEDIGKQKVVAVKEMIERINPSAKKTISIYEKGWTEDVSLSGYVFLCVDDIELRKKIAEKNKFNQTIKVMFDFRTRLTDAQHFACEWNNIKDINAFIETMNFTNEEAKKLTPVTACQVEMGVPETVRIIVTYGVCNFINYTKNLPLKKIVLIDAFRFDTETF